MLVADDEMDINVHSHGFGLTIIDWQHQHSMQPCISRQGGWCFHAGDHHQTASHAQDDNKVPSGAICRQRPSLEPALTSMRSSSGPGMVSNTLAVHMNSTCKGKKPGGSVRLPASQLTLCLAMTLLMCQEACKLVETVESASIGNLGSACKGA